MRQRQRPTRTLPVLWLMTDERVEETRLLRAAARLPHGSGIVLRHYSLSEEARHALFTRLQRIARRHGLILLLAGDGGRAARWGADGVHGHDPGSRRGDRLIRSAPVHDSAELRRAERSGADFIFLSPLFSTRSHPGARPLGPFRFAAMARQARLPVMALGGVGRRHRALLRRLGASGYGAIDSLSR